MQIKHLFILIFLCASSLWSNTRKVVVQESMIDSTWTGKHVSLIFIEGKLNIQLQNGIYTCSSKTKSTFGVPNSRYSQLTCENGKYSTRGSLKKVSNDSLTLDIEKHLGDSIITISRLDLDQAEAWVDAPNEFPSKYGVLTALAIIGVVAYIAIVLTGGGTTTGFQ